MGAYSDRVIADGASHYWRLGEPSGTTAADSIAGGANAPGTISGGVTLNQAGPLTQDGKAMTFNGTTGQIVTAVTVTAPLTCTVEAWLKGNDGAQRPIVSLFSQRPLFYVTSKILRLYDNGNGGINPSGVLVLADGVWHHVAFVLTGTTIAFYVDGALDQSAAAVRTVPETFIAQIGLDDVMVGTQWLGSLAEVAIYPTALSAPTISAHYALRTATGGGASGPPFPWPLALVLEGLS